jgi:hypothetical protein
MIDNPTQHFLVMTYEVRQQRLAIYIYSREDEPMRFVEIYRLLVIHDGVADSGTIPAKVKQLEEVGRRKGIGPFRCSFPITRDVMDLIHSIQGELETIAASQRSKRLTVDVGNS